MSITVTLKRSIKGHLRTRFVKNIFLLMSGTVLAQLITVAATPILGRVFSPEAFGIYSVFNGIVGIIVVAASLQYNVAIVLPKHDEDAACILVLSLTLTVITCLVTALVFSVGGIWLLTTLHAAALISWWWCIPIDLLLTGVYQSFTAWLTRRKYFETSSLSLIIRSISLNLTQLASGAIAAGPLGLISGMCAADLIGSMVAAQPFIKRDYFRFKHAITITRVRGMAREYIEFPAFSTPQGLLNAISQNAPLLLLAFYFDAKVAGLYAVSFRLLQLPVQLFVRSSKQVLYQKACELHNSGADTYAFFRKTTLGLIAVGIIPFMTIVFFAPSIFSFFLGPKWLVAGQYARWMAMWSAIGFINTPAMILAQVYRKQRTLLIYDTALLCSRALALVVGGLYHDALLAIILYSIVGLIFNAGIILWMWQLLKRATDSVIS